MVLVLPLPLRSVLRIRQPSSRPLKLCQQHKGVVEEKKDDGLERGVGKRQKEDEDMVYCIYMVLRLRIPLYSFATAFRVALNNSFLIFNTMRVQIKRAREGSLGSERDANNRFSTSSKLLKLALTEILV